MATTPFDSFPWDEQKFYSPKEVGAFFGRGYDWARSRFRDRPGVVHDPTPCPRVKVRDRANDPIIGPGWVLSQFARRR